MRVERGSVPPAAIIEIEAVRDAVERWETARDQAKSADRQYAELQRGTGRARAEARDAEELAATIEQGEPAPEPRFVREFETALATARREQQARILVEHASWEGVQGAFAAHGDELTEKATKNFETARRGYLRALKALQDAHAKLELTKGLKTFAAGSDGVYRPGGAFLSVSEVTVPLPDADTGGVRVAGVLAALELCGTDRPLYPAGVNPDVLRNEHGHVPPHLQGRAHPISPPEGPATVRVPG